jgi:hypothetical protein
MHEQSITVERDGRYFIESSVNPGRLLEGPFPTAEDADARAAARSQESVLPPYPVPKPEPDAGTAALRTINTTFPVAEDRGMYTASFAPISLQAWKDSYPKKAREDPINKYVDWTKDWLATRVRARERAIGEVAEVPRRTGTTPEGLAYDSMFAVEGDIALSPAAMQVLAKMLPDHFSRRPQALQTEQTPEWELSGMMSENNFPGRNALGLHIENKDPHREILAHELAHVIDRLSMRIDMRDPASIPGDVYGQMVQASRIMSGDRWDDVDSIWARATSPEANRVSSKDLQEDYVQPLMGHTDYMLGPDELVAESLALYMLDPGGFKRSFPAAAAWLRSGVNESPALKGIFTLAEAELDPQDGDTSVV